MAKVLIVYGSGYGQTQKVAEFIAKQLRERGKEVDVVFGKRLPRKLSPETYDAIIVNLPEPETFQINRFFTDRFFELARRRLKPDGILSFAMQGYQNYPAEPQRLKYSSLYNTAVEYFEQVVLRANVPVLVDLGSGAFLDVGETGVRPEPLVSDVVAEGIVDGFESIEVQVEEENRSPGPLREPEVVIAQVVEPPMVVEAREIVDEGEAPKRRRETVAFHRIPDGPLEELRPRFSLDEIVLGSPPHRVQANLLVVHLRQNDDGHVRLEGVGPFEGHDSLAVRQGELGEGSLKRHCITAG